MSVNNWILIFIAQEYLRIWIKRCFIRLLFILRLINRNFSFLICDLWIIMLSLWLIIWLRLINRNFIFVSWLNKIIYPFSLWLNIKLRLITYSGFKLVKIFIFISSNKRNMITFLLFKIRLRLNNLILIFISLLNKRTCMISLLIKINFRLNYSIFICYCRWR